MSTMTAQLDPQVEFDLASINFNKGSHRPYPQNSEAMDINTKAAQCMTNLDSVRALLIRLKKLVSKHTGHRAPHGGFHSHKAMGGIRTNLDKGGVGGREKNNTGLGHPSSRVSGTSLSAAGIAGRLMLDEIMPSFWKEFTEARG
ncbi:hypothetical protein DFH06DRAFT_1132117 [Mycena polygramma]|nr:hypothetical protein DFH06DRAFT_1132117 [Mycena polygramma]